MSATHIDASEKLRCALKLKTESLLAAHLSPELFARIKFARRGGTCFNPVFDKKKIIFVHIPKNGGTSIAAYLSGDPTLTYAHWRLVDYYADSPERAASYHKFCVVRNPWDRMVSAFYYLKNQPKAVTRKSVVFAESQVVPWSFTEFVRRLQKEHFLMSWLHFRPQWEYVVYNGVNGMDSVLRFEELDEDFCNLGDRLGLWNGAPPHLNGSRRKPRYHDYYDEKTKDIVAKLYADDIAAFGYSFD